MQDVLDEPDQQLQRPDGYARLAFGVSLITMSLLLYLLFFTPLEQQMFDIIPRPSPVVVTLTLVFCLLGVILSVASVQRKESLSWYKVVGTLLNCLWLVLVIALVLFAQIMDLI